MFRRPIVFSFSSIGVRFVSSIGSVVRSFASWLCLRRYAYALKDRTHPHCCQVRINQQLQKDAFWLLLSVSKKHLFESWNMFVWMFSFSRCSCFAILGTKDVILSEEGLGQGKHKTWMLVEKKTLRYWYLGQTPKKLKNVLLVLITFPKWHGLL